jgi:hypothetical protein
VAYSIHCTLVEVPQMSEALRRRGLPGYVDMVPWADPYIAALLEKVQSEGGSLLTKRTVDRVRAPQRAEAPPPAFEEFTNPGRDFNWPRRGKFGEAS